MVAPKVEPWASDVPKELVDLLQSWTYATATLDSPDGIHRHYEQAHQAVALGQAKEIMKLVGGWLAAAEVRVANENHRLRADLSYALDLLGCPCAPNLRIVGVHDAALCPAARSVPGTEKP